MPAYSGGQSGGGASLPNLPDTQIEIQDALNGSAATGAWQDVTIEPGQLDVTEAGSVTAGVEYCLLANGKSRLRIRGSANGTTLRFQQSTTVADDTHCIVLQDCDEVEIEDMRFEGLTSDDDSATALKAAIYVYGTTTKVTVRNCVFTNCAPATTASTAGAQFSFVGCRVVNAANALTLGSAAFIRDSFFVNDTLGADRSHAIYQFGTFNDTVITGCYFENITDFALKWKGNNAELDRKRGLIFTNNHVVNANAAVEVGSDSEVVHENIVVSNNTIRNSQIGVKGFALSRAVVADNVIVWDRENTRTGCKAITVSNSGIGSNGATAISRSLMIRGNVMENTANVIAQITVGSATAGDTFTLGADTYTWVAGAPASATEVQASATATTAANNLYLALKGSTSFATPASALAQPSDVQLDGTDIYINVPTTGVALSETGTSVTITSAFSDVRAAFDIGIELVSCPGTIEVCDNYIRDAEVAYSASRCVRPRLKNNKFHGSVNPTAATPYWVLSEGCVYAEYDGNTFETTPATQDSAGRRAQLHDGWPLVGHNPGLDGWANTKVQEDLLGRYGEIDEGTTASKHTFLYFGSTAVGGSMPESSQSKGLIWHTGDTVEIDDGDGNVHTYTYRLTSPGAGEFNSKAGLIALIDAETTFTATDYDAWFSAYIKITSTGSAPTITVTTDAACNGITLGSDFLDGTVVWTPLAAAVRPCFVQPANTTAAATNPLAHRADVIEGVAYKVTHTAAPGSKFKFWISG